ncbi:hypothetical protein GCM10023221_08060 [Luteimicrobium xylanilyticum]|uniref:LysM domain-containing protein n=1 Tax=Luteimicrobium xylanilyticum TaxID=1133546 RepID=A0A5P9QC87_9MICO|nr:hypothetical protein [Luteimicrobium xylanilyticum]QFU99027.1 hypothetical protein KDY119_02553 [Luteimicrobium xylanilyticum]
MARTEQRTTAAARVADGAGPLGALAGLLGLVVAAPTLAAWLVVVTHGLVAPALGPDLDLASRLDVLGVERLVAVPILLIGAVVAVRLTVHTLLALGYVAAARAGRPLPRLRSVVARRAPVLVRALARRAVGAGMGMGMGMSLGAGVALAGTAAAVTAPAAMAAPAAVTVVEQGAAGSGADAGTDSAASRPDAARPANALDLGWHETVTTPDDGTRHAAATKARSGTQAAALDLGWHPLAAARPAAAASTVARATDAERPTHVTVRRGDSLWAVAAAHLGPHATDAEIARAWPRWYEANSHVIGADPDLLLPGTVLVAPEPA